MSGHQPSTSRKGGGGGGRRTMNHPDLVELEQRLTEEVDEDFFQDPKKFRTLHRVIDVLGAQLLNSPDGELNTRQTSDFDSYHRNNPAYITMERQQKVVEEAIEHMAVSHCSDLNSSVVAVGKVARQFNEAATRVEGLRRQVRDIKDHLGSGDANPNEAEVGGAGRTGAVGRSGVPDGRAATPSGGKSLRELWLKKLECEAVLSLLHKLEKIRRAPTTFDALISPTLSGAGGVGMAGLGGGNQCRIGAAVTLLVDALDTMFSDDVAQVQALHKIMEQLMARKQRAEEIIWEALSDVVYLRTANSIRPAELEQEGGLVAAAGPARARKHVYISGEKPGERWRGNVGGVGDDDDLSLGSEDDGPSFGAVGGVGGRTVPKTILDTEIDLEADEIRCLEEMVSEAPLPRYTDPVLALRILVESLARLGRLDDIERVLGDSVDRELRRIAQIEQARTYARLERKRASRRGVGSLDAAVGQVALAETDDAMREFRIHLSNLLVAFGSVVLRLSHLAQIARHRIISDPQLVERFTKPKNVLYPVLLKADTAIQEEVKGFLEACLNEGDRDTMVIGGLDDGRNVASHERGIFSLGIVSDASSRKNSKSTSRLASRTSIMELSSDKFVTNVLFPRTNMVAQVRHALTFRRSVATWSAESADLQLELAKVTGEDTPLYNNTTNERAIDYLDVVIQKNLLPMLQEEAVNGTIAALEREDAFEPRIDPGMYASNKHNVNVEMCVACQALYRYTGPLFSALHRLPKGGHMYSPLVAVLDHAILTFNSRVKQRVGYITRGKKAQALLDVKSGLSGDIELRKSYTMLMQAYFGEDDVHSAGGVGAAGGDKGADFDFERENDAFQLEISHLRPLLDFNAKNYGKDFDVCKDDELGRAACLAHSLLKVASLLESRLGGEKGNEDKNSPDATSNLRAAIKTIRKNGIRMAKFCRVDMLIQVVKRMSMIYASSSLFAKDAVRLPSCVNDLGEHLTSAGDILGEAGGNTIVAYAFSSLEQYVPLFLMQSVRSIAQNKGRKNGAIITLNGVEALDRSGSVLYRDLKGATSITNSMWDDDVAAESFERSASYVAMIELDMDELVSYSRENMAEFTDEDFKLMFRMDGPRRKGDISLYRR